LRYALAPIDRDKLAEKVLTVEALILERLRQLQQSNGQDEQEAIRDGLPMLRIIKRDKLDFPDWH
jgi:hypothetical protein